MTCRLRPQRTVLQCRLCLANNDVELRATETPDEQQIYKPKNTKLWARVSYMRRRQQNGRHRWSRRWIMLGFRHVRRVTTFDNARVFELQNWFSVAIVGIARDIRAIWQWQCSRKRPTTRVSWSRLWQIQKKIGGVRKWPSTAKCFWWIIERMWRCFESEPKLALCRR